MKAPDKVYVSIGPRQSLIARAGQTLKSDIEYLRKDALLEWARRLKEKWEEPPMSRHSPGCVYMLEQVIKKIENL